MLSHAYHIVIDCGVRAPVHDKYVIDSLSANDKRFLKKFMTTAQISGGSTNYSQMFIYTTMNNTYIILVGLFQKHISYSIREHVLIDREINRKWASKRKWKECEYPVQDKKYVQHKSVKC